MENLTQACMCTFLSRRTLQVVQVYNLLQHSLLPVVILVSVVPNYLQIIIKLLLCSFGLIPHFSKTSCIELQTEANVILYFFYFQIITPRIVTFLTNF